MSEGKLTLRYTHNAQVNFRHLLAKSEELWGARQAEVYEDEIFATLDVLREHPGIGISRPDLAPGCRSYPVKAHVIYYRITDKSLEVLRILHKRQRTQGQFDDLD